MPLDCICRVDTRTVARFWFAQGLTRDCGGCFAAVPNHVLLDMPLLLSVLYLVLVL